MQILYVFWLSAFSGVSNCWKVEQNVNARFVRDRRASYQQSLSVLEHAKHYKPNLMTKTSIMLGHGETDDQVMKTMQGNLSSAVEYCCHFCLSLGNGIGIWASLPVNHDIRDHNSEATFKKHLKTFLFHVAFT